MIFAVDMEAALEISYICLGRNLASVISKRDFGKTNRNGLRGYQRFGNGQKFQNVENEEKMK